jgi:hypothetical protein
MEEDATKPAIGRKPTSSSGPAAVQESVKLARPKGVRKKRMSKAKKSSNHTRPVGIGLAPCPVERPATQLAQGPPTLLTLVPVSSPPKDYPIYLEVHYILNSILRSMPTVSGPMTRQSLSFVKVYRALRVDAYPVLDLSELPPKEVRVECRIRDRRNAMPMDTLIIPDLRRDSEANVLERCDAMRKASNYQAVIELQIWYEVGVKPNDKERSATPGREPTRPSETPAPRPGQWEAYSLRSTPMSESSFQEQETSPASSVGTLHQIREARNEARVDSARRAGDLEAALRSRWKCRDHDCQNLWAFCWVDEDTPPQHYKLDPIHIDAWIHQIKTGAATIEKPWIRLVKALMERDHLESKAKEAAELVESLQSTLATMQETATVHMNMVLAESNRRIQETMERL